MDKAVRVFLTFADKDTIRIFKMLTKKMLTAQQIADVMEGDEHTVQKHLDKLLSIEVIKLLPGPDKTYFAKSQSAIFDQYAGAVTSLINKWYNKDEQIINDFYKLNNIKK